MSKKRMLALVLAAMMCVSSSVVAFAENDPVDTAAPTVAANAGAPEETENSEPEESESAEFPGKISTNLTDQTVKVGETIKFSISTSNAPNEDPPTVIGALEQGEDPNPDDPSYIAYFKEGEQWKAIEGNNFGGNGFPFMNIKTNFKIEFKKPGVYTFVVVIKSVDDSKTLCKTDTITITVEGESGAPGSSSENPVKTGEELITALDAKMPVIYLDGEVSLNKAYTEDITYDVALIGQNNAIIKAGYSVEGKEETLKGGVLNFRDCTASIRNVKVDVENSKQRYGLQFYNAEGKMENVEITGGEYAALLVNGSDVTVVDCTFESNSPWQADVDFGMGTASEKPVLSVSGGNIGEVYVDETSLANLQKAGYIESSVDLKDSKAVAQALGSLFKADEEIPVLIKTDASSDPVSEVVVPNTPFTQEEPAERNRNDGGDYYGNQKWDEVKREIVDAKDGDTIKVSGTGLPYFPSSVARALKGKDITLEVRKNGVTYSVNGLEIGAIDKIWYEFEDLETELLTETPAEDEEKDETSSQSADEDKANPDTGR